jgi:hypothetical protein
MSSDPPAQVGEEHWFNYEIRADDAGRFLQFLKNTWRDVGYEIAGDSLTVVKSKPGDPGTVEGHIHVEETRRGEVIERERRVPETVPYVIAFLGIVIGLLGAVQLSVWQIVGGMAAAVAGYVLLRYDQPVMGETDYQVRIETTAEIEHGGSGDQREDQREGLSSDAPAGTTLDTPSTVTVHTTVYTPRPNETNPDLQSNLETIDSRMTEFFDQ